jgi:WD40 repeat protein
VTHQFRPAAREHFRKAWISPDAARMVTKTQDELDRFRIEIVDVREKKVLAEFRYPMFESRVEYGEFAPDGSQFALEVRAGEIQRFDPRTGRQLPPMRTDAEKLLVVMKFSPDGRTFATSTYGEKFLNLWDTRRADALPTRRTAIPVGEVSGGANVAWRVSFSPDSRGVVVYHEPRNGLWVSACDVATGTIRYSLKAEEAGPFSPDGRCFLTGCFGSKETLYVWDTSTGAQLRALPGEKQTIAVFSADGQYLLTAGEKTPVRLWPMKAQSRSVHVAELRSKAPDNRFRQIGQVHFSPDGSYLLVWSNALGDGGSIFSVATGTEQCVLQRPGQNASPYAVALSNLPAAAGAVAVGKRSQGAPPSTAVFMGWDLATGRGGAEARFDSPPQAGDTNKKGVTPRGVALSPDNRFVAATGDIPFCKPVICVFRYPSFQRVHAFCDLPSVAHCLRFSADGKLLAASLASPSQLMMWDLSTGQSRVLPMNHHHDQFELLDNGRTVWCVSNDDSLGCWDVATGQVVRRIPGKDMVAPHVRRFERIALSPAGNAFATGDDRGVVLVRDPTSGQALHTLNGHQAAITAIAFSPDGSVLATGDRQGQARLWKLGSRTSKPEVASNDPQPSARVKEPTNAARMPKLSPWGSFVTSIGNVDPRDACMVFSQDSSKLVFSRDDGDAEGLQVWNLAARTTTCAAPEFRTASRLAASMSPDGGLVAGSCYFSDGEGNRRSECPAILDTNSGDVKKLPVELWKDTTRLLGNNLICGATNSDGRQLVLANLEAGAIIKTVACYDIQDVTRSPDGKWLAVVEGKDKLNRCVSLFDAHTLERKAEWRGLIERARTRFTSDGKGILTEVQDSHNELCMLDVPGLRKRWGIKGGYISSTGDSVGPYLLCTHDNIALVDVVSGIPRLAFRLDALRDKAKRQLGAERVRKPMAVMGGAWLLFGVDGNRLAVCDPATGTIGDAVVTEVNDIVLTAVSPQRDYLAVLGETREGWLVQVFRTAMGNQPQ